MPSLLGSGSSLEHVAEEIVAGSAAGVRCELTPELVIQLPASTLPEYVDDPGERPWVWDLED